jgi:hypothetical protein
MLGPLLYKYNMKAHVVTLEFLCPTVSILFVLSAWRIGRISSTEVNIFIYNVKIIRNMS